MGTVSLVSLVQPAPEWEYPLKEMERFAYELKGKRKPIRSYPWTKQARTQSGFTSTPTGWMPRSRAMQPAWRESAVAK